jgi:hypothetical protein
MKSDIEYAKDLRAAIFEVTQLADPFYDDAPDTVQLDALVRAARRLQQVVREIGNDPSVSL